MIFSICLDKVVGSGGLSGHAGAATHVRGSLFDHVGRASPRGPGRVRIRPTEFSTGLHLKVERAVRCVGRCSAVRACNHFACPCLSLSSSCRCGGGFLVIRGCRRRGCQEHAARGRQRRGRAIFHSRVGSSEARVIRDRRLFCCSRRLCDREL